MSESPHLSQTDSQPTPHDEGIAGVCAARLRSSDVVTVGQLAGPDLYRLMPEAAETVVRAYWDAYMPSYGARLRELEAERDRLREALNQISDHDAVSSYRVGYLKVRTLAREALQLEQGGRDATAD